MYSLVLCMSVLLVCTCVHTVHTYMTYYMLYAYITRVYVYGTTRVVYTVDQAT